MRPRPVDQLRSQKQPLRLCLRKSLSMQDQRLAPEVTRFSEYFLGPTSSTPLRNKIEVLLLLLLSFFPYCKWLCYLYHLMLCGKGIA